MCYICAFFESVLATRAIHGTKLQVQGQLLVDPAPLDVRVLNSGRDFCVCARMCRVKVLEAGGVTPGRWTSGIWFSMVLYQMILSIWRFYDVHMVHWELYLIFVILIIFTQCPKSFLWKIMLLLILTICSILYGIFGTIVNLVLTMNWGVVWYT